MLTPSAQAAYGQLGAFGTFGTGNSQFTKASRVAVNVPDNQVFVLDVDLRSFPNRFHVKEFDLNGNFVRVLYSEVSTLGGGQIRPGISDIAVDPTLNRLYVLRTVPSDSISDSKIEQLTTGPGTVVKSDFVADTQVLKDPSAIAVDPVNGSVFVAGTDVNDDPKMRKFNPANGNTVGNLFGPPGGANGQIEPGEFGDGADGASIFDIAVRNNGAATLVYALDTWTVPPEDADQRPTDPAEDAPRVQRFTVTGTAWSLDGPTTRNPTPSSAEFFSTDNSDFDSQNIAVASSGDVYLDQNDTAGVIKFTQAGTELQRFGSIGSGVCQFAANPPPIDLGTAGQVYALDQGVGGPPQRVLKFGDGGTGCLFPPVAAFDITPVKPDVGEDVTFDASDSYDPSGAPITHYEWDLDGNGTFETDGGASPTVHKTFSAAGPGDVRLRVTNGSAVTGDILKSIRIYSPPVAAFNFSPLAPRIGQLVTFDAAGSSDNDSDPELGITKYEWDFDGNGSFEVDSGTDPQPTHTFNAVGPVDVTVRVTDDEASTDAETHQVTVSADNAPPTAFFSFSPSSPQVGQIVTFNGSLSIDDSAITKYEWDLDGNGSFEKDTGATPTTTTSYATIGTRNVQLRVTDDEGAQDSDGPKGVTVVAVPVVAPPTPPPAGPGPPAVPPPTSVSSLSLPGGSLTVAGGVVKLNLGCGAGAACAGKLTLQTAKAVAAKKKKKKRILALGSASYQVPAGGKTTVQIKLSSKAQKLLKKLKKISARLSAKSSSGAGAGAAVASTLTLKPGKK